MVQLYNINTDEIYKNLTTTHLKFAVEVVVFNYGSFLPWEILKKYVGTLFSSLSYTLVMVVLSFPAFRTFWPLAVTVQDAASSRRQAAECTILLFVKD